jgi:serine/threonine-protein kinase
VRHLRKLSTSPNIPNLLGFGEISEDTPWYAAEYFEQDLRRKIGLDISNRDRLAKTSKANRPKSLGLEQSLLILMDILEALSAYHAKDIIHGNIRPEVIIFDENNQLKLALFAASARADGIDRYPAPEFHESPEDTDQRADIYSFAVLSYRILTGKLPTGRYKDPLYYVPEMSPALNNLILDSLAEQPNERPYNSVELLIKLKACFDEKFSVIKTSSEQSHPEKEIQLTLMKSAPDSDASEPNEKIPLIEKLQAKEEKLDIAKEELQNLKKKIIRIFRENGNIPEREWNNLVPIGSLNGLDKKALNELISHLKTEHKEDIEPAIKFVKSIDQYLLESQLSLSQKTVKSLEEEALKISWDKTNLF